MVKKIVFNPDKCTGCRICMLECAVSHGDGNVIDYFKSRIRIRTNKEKIIQVAGVCVQCDERYCIDACPCGAITIDARLGTIKISESLCRRCGACAKACPYNGISVVEKDKVIACDLCGGDPACVKWCPTKAITYMEITGENLSEVERLHEKMIELNKEVYSP